MRKKKEAEYAIYGILFIFLCMGIVVLIKAPCWSQKLLALPVIVSIIGVIGSMWRFLRCQETVEDADELKRQQIKRLEDANKELEKANRLKEQEVDLLKE